MFNAWTKCDTLDVKGEDLFVCEDCQGLAQTVGRCDTCPDKEVLGVFEQYVEDDEDGYPHPFVCFCYLENMLEELLDDR